MFTQLINVQLYNCTQLRFILIERTCKGTIQILRNQDFGFSDPPPLCDYFDYLLSFGDIGSKHRYL